MTNRILLLSLCAEKYRFHKYVRSSADVGSATYPVHLTMRLFY